MAMSYAYLAVLFAVMQLAAAQMMQVTYNRYITSRNGRNNISSSDPMTCLSNNYGRLQVQHDGNLCAYYGTKPSPVAIYVWGWWCSNGEAKPLRTHNTILREDGKLCTYPSSAATYDDSTAVWCSNNNPGPTTNTYFTILRNDGNICTYSGGTWQNPQNEVWCAGASDSQNRFSLIVTSDPQMPWWDKEFEEPGTQSKAFPDVNYRNQPSGTIANPSGSLWAYGKMRIRQQYASINWLIDNKHIYNPQGIIINGDLTAWGEPAQLNEFKSLSSVFSGKQWVYKGLGNHDYNQGDDSDAVKYKAGILNWMAWDIKQIPTLQSRNFDESVSNLLVGSLSYSFDIGPLHIIQLQLHPKIEQDISYNGKRYIIKQSMDWLRHDLNAHQFKIIMINMHSYEQIGGDWNAAEFNDLIRGYPNVAAIFSGHLHQHCGLYGKQINGANIPQFRSGSASWGCYLTAEFNFATLDMTVRRVVNDYCGYAHYNLTNEASKTKSYMTATCGLGSKQKDKECNVDCQSNNGQSCEIFKGRSLTNTCINGLDLPY